MSEEESTPAKSPDEKFCRKAQDACSDNACDVLSSKQAFEDDDTAEGGGGDDGETGEAEEEEEIVFATAPFDPRFPNQNQTKHCYSSFVDYKRCVKMRGDDYPPCEYYKRVYNSMCPNAWVEKWEGQIEKGTFPTPI